MFFKTSLITSKEKPIVKRVDYGDYEMNVPIIFGLNVENYNPPIE